MLCKNRNKLPQAQSLEPRVDCATTITRRGLRTSSAALSQRARSSPWTCRRSEAALGAASSIASRKTVAWRSILRLERGRRTSRGRAAARCRPRGTRHRQREVGTAAADAPGSVLILAPRRIGRHAAWLAQVCDRKPQHARQGVHHVDAPLGRHAAPIAAIVWGNDHASCGHRLVHQLPAPSTVSHGANDPHRGGHPGEPGPRGATTLQRHTAPATPLLGHNDLAGLPAQSRGRRWCWGWAAIFALFLKKNTTEMHGLSGCLATTRRRRV